MDKCLILQCPYGGLELVVDNNQIGYYGYDGNGERVYKLTGTNSTNQLNSGSPYAQAIFDDAVLYPNPYMVVTPKGYTKHYYAGTERLATVIGKGGFEEMVSPAISLSSQEIQNFVEPFFFHYGHHTYDPFYYEHALSLAVPNADIHGEQPPELQYHCQPIDLEYVEAIAINDILRDAIYDNQQVNDTEDEIYFYHGDHLGSANWITDYSGRTTQYLHYAPYGELIDNQQATQYDERYKFTGKERDWETGYDYYGARFLWSAIGHWLSVDPLADKYPNISPYAYAAWNPVKYVDPNGREIINKVSPSDKTRYDAGNNIIDLKDNHIFFVSHGSPTAMYPHGQGEMNAEGFVNYLKENSKVWQKTEDKSSIVIVLIACETGKGDNPIAQQISKLLPEATIVAPTEEAKAAEDGGRAYVTGVAKKDAATLGDAKKPENAGQWNAYRNGELIGHSANGNVNYIYKDDDF